MVIQKIAKSFCRHGIINMDIWRRAFQAFREHQSSTIPKKKKVQNKIHKNWIDVRCTASLARMPLMNKKINKARSRQYKRLTIFYIQEYLGILALRSDSEFELWFRNDQELEKWNKEGNFLFFVANFWDTIQDWWSLKEWKARLRFAFFKKTSQDF